MKAAQIAKPESPGALFHLGLHKTGTTSFQHGLFRARERLRVHGVAYAAPPGKSFPEQHAEIAEMLKQSRVGEVRTYFQGLIDMAAAGPEPRVRLFLFSSEEFSNLAQDALAAFRQAVVESFPNSRYVLVLRNALDLTLSMLMQDIDAGLRTPAQAASKAVILNTLQSFTRKVRLVLGALEPVTVIDYEEARASGDLNNFLARKCLGPDAPVLENLNLNVRRPRDEQMVGLLLSQMRSMIATLRSSNPYSKQVNATLGKVVDARKLARCVSAEKAAKLAQIFETRLRKKATAVYTANSPRLLAEASALPESCVRILFPDLARGG